MNNAFLAETDFEKCVISRMMVDQQAVSSARGILEDGHDFITPAYGVAFNALCRHADTGGQWDLTAIANLFADTDGLFELIGEADGFKHLLTFYHTSCDVLAHCKAIRKAALKQRLITMLKRQTGQVDIDGLFADIQQLKDELAILDKVQKVESGGKMVKRIIADAVSGRIAEIEMPFRVVNSLAKPLRTGAVCLLAGNIGAAKTFFLLQILSKSVMSGIKSAALFLEEGTDHYIHRLWAQRAGCADLTSLDFLKANSDYADQLADEHTDYLDIMRPAIHTTPDRMMTYRQCVAWVEQQAIDGARLIAVDPVTALDEQGQKPWEIHKTFIDKIKKLAVDYSCAILLTTHPVKATSLPSMEAVSGGAAYTRFVQNILWLENHPEKESRILYATGSENVTHDRTLYILKTRSKGGTFKKVAFNMDSKSLTLTEIGLIGKKVNNFME